MIFLKKNGAFLAVGALAGFINGLLGAGGGIIVAYFLSKKFNGENKNDAFANAVATMLPISIVSLLLYVVNGSFIPDVALFSLLPAGMIGGVLGAYLLTKIKFKFIKALFSVLVAVSGILMIVR